MKDEDKNAYRTPADAPEPEWRDLAKFEVEVDQINNSDGARLIAWKAMPSGTRSLEHGLQTKDLEVAKKLRLGQRVRVILQVIR